MNINFELYKTFFYVAKNKNITKASHELMISQPAISKSIKSLEEQINCSLFIRNKYGVTLTEEGEQLFENIKPAIEMIDNAEKRLQETLNLECGTLSIGVSNTLTQNYLLPYIEKYHKLYPKIKIKIVTNPTFQLITQARNGLIDLIILNLPYELPSDFRKINLKKVTDCFFTNSNWKNLKETKTPLKNLKEYPLILIAKGSSTRNFLDNFCEKNNVMLTPEIELTSHHLVTSFAKIGLGIGYGTKEFIQKELKNKELFEIKTIPEIPKRYIGACFLKQKEINKASQTFLELLKKEEQN